MGAAKGTFQDDNRSAAFGPEYVYSHNQMAGLAEDIPWSECVCPHARLEHHRAPSVASEHPHAAVVELYERPPFRS